MGDGGFGFGGPNIPDFSDLIQDFAEATVAALVRLIEEIAFVLFQAIVLVARVVLKAGVFLKHLWTNGIAKVLTNIAKLLQRAHQFLESKLAPVIKFLKRVRAIIDRYYKLYLKPYLAFIQKIRRYLLILKLLHVKFAAQLDARLAKQEAIITRVFLDVRGTVNMVLNTLGALTDPRKLSRWVLASVAGRRVAAATVRALTGLPLGHFAPSNAVDRFAWERPPLTKRDYTDPRFNPPPSVILGGLFSGPSLDGTLDPDPPDDATLDASQPLDYFDNIRSSLLAGEDVYDDMDEADLSITETIEQGTGALATGAQVVGSFAASLAA